MKKKLLFMLVTLLLSYGSIFAQSGDGFIEIKPINPPNQPPFGGAKC